MAGRSLDILGTRLVLCLVILMCLCAANAQLAEQGAANPRIIYRNPRVYNVDYSFEMTPDPNGTSISPMLCSAGATWQWVEARSDTPASWVVFSPHAARLDPGGH
jgi:hypothetical protein